MFGLSVKKIENWGKKARVSRLEKVLSNRNIEFRNAAIKALGESRDEEAINLLINCTRHPDPEVRKLTAQAMGDSGFIRTIEFLRQLAREDQDQEVREVALEASKKINEKINLADK